MALAIPSGTYGVDSMHTQLGFSVTHLGISVIRGTFDRFTGWLSVGDGLGETSVSLEAEMASVNSGNAMRDQHLQGADFFDVANHPTLTFTSSSIEEAGAGYDLHGSLTIKGISHPVVLAVTFNGSAVFPMNQSTHFGFSARSTISRTAFNMGYGVPMASDDVKLQLEAQFVSPAPTG
ncbi:MAG: YceI family protein [Acidimicrobiales bacterium]